MCHHRMVRLPISFTTLAIGAVLLSAPSSRAGELDRKPDPGPRRFVEVEEWYGLVQARIRGSGNYQATDGTEEHYSIDRRVEVTFRIVIPKGLRLGMEAAEKTLRQAGAFIPPQARRQMEKSRDQLLWAPAVQAGAKSLEDFQKKEQSTVASINDSRGGIGWVGGQATARKAPFFRAMQGRGDEQEATRAKLQMDLAAATYDLDVTWNDVVTATETSSGKARPPSQEHVTNTKLDVKGLALPPGGLMLKGHEDIDLKTHRPPYAGNYGELKGTIDWVLTPKPLEDLEVVVEVPGLETWLPEGTADESKPGNHLSVKATLQKKGGGEPTDETCEAIDFDLREVSWEPGAANNAPRDPTRVGPDLSFEPADNPGLRVDGTGSSHARAERPGYTASAKVACWDYGAWGTLRVEALTGLGRFVRGRLAPKPVPGHPEFVIPLPWRKPDSKIADDWKKSQSADLADDSDDDMLPAGDGKAGDGLTLYEEYRGFVANGAHLRTDPKKKDFFLNDRNKDPRVRTGIALFASLSELEVHDDLKDDELKDRRVNANSRTVTGGAQHGVIIEPFTSDPKYEGIAYAKPVDPSKVPNTPKGYDSIIIHASLLTTPAETGTRGGRPVTGPDMAKITVAHELFHTVRVSHHGDLPGDHDVRWVVRKTAAGGWEVTEFPPGNVVKVVKEDRTDYPWKMDMDMDKIHIGAKGGVYSGAWDCVMRYSNANAYIDPAGAGTRVDVHHDDFGGESICTDKLGTGINDSSWPGGSRFGDATAGNCKGQIRVKDWGIR